MNEQGASGGNEKTHRLDDVITIPELAKRLHIHADRAYELAMRPGFPLFNITGGERGNRTIWGDALDWIRANCRAVS